jgi:hypothetical protein
MKNFGSTTQLEFRNQFYMLGVLDIEIMDLPFVIQMFTGRQDKYAASSNKFHKKTEEIVLLKLSADVQVLCSDLSRGILS